MDGVRRLTKGGNHAGRNGVAEDSSKVIDEPSDNDGLVPQSPRWSLRHDGIASGSNSDHITQRRNDQQDSNSHLHVLAVGKTETANRQEAEEHEGQATHVNS